jgi:hypothetical protein
MTTTEPQFCGFDGELGTTSRSRLSRFGKRRLMLLMLKLPDLHRFRQKSERSRTSLPRSGASGRSSLSQFADHCPAYSAATRG